MREASIRRTVTDTDSYAFFIPIIIANERKTEATNASMLKRLLMALLLMPLAFVVNAAQLTATLQSGDNVTPFYGSDAFVNAYKAASAGDVITLSPGSFTTTAIDKSITIIGAYAFDDATSTSTVLPSLTVTADDVTFEAVRITGTLTIKAADNLVIRSSYINDASDTTNGDKVYHSNTLHTDCIISSYGAMSLSKNTVFINCCINSFTTINDSMYPAYILNCNIPIFSHQVKSNDNYMEDHSCQPFAIYKNSFLGLFSQGFSNSSRPILNLESPSEFNNVVFYENNGAFFYINFNSCTTNECLGSFGHLGIDDVSKCEMYDLYSPFTYKNVHYGPLNFKLNPSIPVIISSEIDTATDAEGKIHIKISATARD